MQSVDFKYTIHNLYTQIYIHNTVKEHTTETSEACHLLTKAFTHLHAHVHT